MDKRKLTEFVRKHQRLIIYRPSSLIRSQLRIISLLILLLEISSKTVNIFLACATKSSYVGQALHFERFIQPFRLLDSEISHLMWKSIFAHARLKVKWAQQWVSRSIRSRVMDFTKKMRDEHPQPIGLGPIMDYSSFCLAALHLRCSESRKAIE